MSADDIDSMDDVRDRVRRFLAVRHGMDGSDPEVIYAIGLRSADGSGQTTLKASDLYRLLGDSVPKDIADRAARDLVASRRPVPGEPKIVTLTLVKRSLRQSTSDRMYVRFEWAADDGYTIYDNIARDEPVAEWKREMVAVVLGSTVEAIVGYDPAEWLEGRRVRAALVVNPRGEFTSYMVQRYFKMPDSVESGDDTKEEVQDGR